ncbi:MAG TPA: TlpA disulfide reductase family protein [Acidimicrobiia bacterium]|nr:TlpA disulfide reductase family protein [Acidimicrobiia bacterium]
MKADVEAGADPVTPPGGRWRLGILTLVAVAAVMTGMLLFGNGSDDDPTGPTLPSGLEPPAGTPRSGQAAPDFSITTFDGEPFSLTSHLAGDGRAVLLNLWASWCPPCRAEMPVFDKVAADRAADVLVIGVAVDDALAPARAFAEQIGVRYPLAFDADGTVAARYPAPGLPTTFMISAAGELVSVSYGELDEDEMNALIDEAGG